MTTPQNGPLGENPGGPNDPTRPVYPEATTPMSDEPTQRVTGPEATTVWQPQTPPQPMQPQSWEERQRAYPPVGELAPVGKSVLVAVAVVLAVALVSVAVFFTVRHNGITPVAVPSNPTTPVPVTPGPVTTSAEPPATTPQPTDPLANLAAQPLSAASATMNPSTCALPRFDLPDAKQAQFFQAAKKCADDAWGATLPSAGIAAASVKVVTVQGSPVRTGCGSVGPADTPTQCQGTVYMTPAYLRDVQGNGRYPGKYFGTFLREYGHALQDVSGITAMYTAARAEPDADQADLDRRYDDQAICLAGIASAAMANRGAVDGNITNEIRERITTGDAPADAATWLDRGFATRTLSACNTWQG